MYPDCSKGPKVGLWKANKAKIDCAEQSIVLSHPSGPSRARHRGSFSRRMVMSPVWAGIIPQPPRGVMPDLAGGVRG